jgi:hypothetical protein
MVRQILCGKAGAVDRGGEFIIARSLERDVLETRYD